MVSISRPGIFDDILKRAIGDNNSDLGDEKTPGVGRDEQQGEANVLKSTMQGFNTAEPDAMAINAQKETETQQKHKANEPNRTGEVLTHYKEKPIETSFINKSCRKMDLSWEHLNIRATTKKRQIGGGKKRKSIKEDKTILNNVSGSVRNGKFTAIMGPSGSGKTTLLNLLSARISGKNLKINGIVKINGHPIEKLETFTSSLAYVMQDDILVATMTPKGIPIIYKSKIYHFLRLTTSESLMFVANLRLRIPMEERKKKVAAMLDELKLSHIANTKIGNNLIRGISGGERKRVSIGVELITDPSMIFLDEPTTGLDSKTAETVIGLLVALAQKGGRTVVSTIHQPSSQIYSLFDMLLILVKGYTIYQGPAKDAVPYFSSIGFKCPKLTNPADYYMKIVNESGIMIEMMEKDHGKKASRTALQMSPEEIEKKFAQRLEVFKKGYNESGMEKRALEGLESDKVNSSAHRMVNWFKQFHHLFIRKILYEIRNPMETKVKIFQKLLFSIIIMLAFNNLQTGPAGVQNRDGVLFFYCVMAFMAGVQGSIGTFSGERPIFIRERLSKTYSTSAYFWANVAAELPLLITQPVVLVAPSYYVIHLSASASKYFILIVIAALTTIAGSGYGLLISTFVPSMELAMTLVPILMIPMMLFAGFFVSQDKIPYFFYEFLYISPVKYAFQASVQNEFSGSDVCDTCNYYSTLGNYQGIGLSIVILVILSVGLRFISYFGLGLISAPKKAKVQPPKENYEADSATQEKSKK